MGEKGLTPQQVSFGEPYHPGYVKRPPDALANLEGGSAITGGCTQCHAVGKPNSDSTISNCTSCHTRHTSSVAIARLSALVRSATWARTIRRSKFTNNHVTALYLRRKSLCAWVVIIGLHKDGVPGPQPFQTPVDFLAFDLALRRGHLQARCLHGRRRFCAMACTIKSLAHAPLGGFARPAGTLFENVIAGAPPLAPLLLPKLSILGFIGIAAVLREAQT